MKGLIERCDTEIEDGGNFTYDTITVKIDHKDMIKLREMNFINKNCGVEIDFNPIEYKCNCANDTIDSLSYSCKFLDDNVKGKISLPENVKMDLGKLFDIMKKRYVNKHKNEVIFNEPATVLYKDGKKYVSKCDKEDKFSEELGLALCLLKSFGVSYSDFEKLLNSAKRQGEKDNEE